MTKTIEQMAKGVRTDKFIPSLNVVLNEIGETFFKKGAYAVIDRLEQIIQSGEEPAVLYPKIVEAIKELKGESTLSTKEFQLVDLGLSSGTLWADRNLGADAPEETGDYYRFGETIPFTEDSHKYVYDEIDGNIAGTDRDAATVNLGKNYRMPTFDQIKELLDECKWKWTKQNGVNGMKVTGPNGNSIFFPASGYRYYDDGSLSNVGSYGCYWSASTSNGNNCHTFDFFLGEGNWGWYRSNRANGFPVRPVAERKFKH